MSVLNDLQSIEKQLIARLRELEPTMAEYDELRRAAERLGLRYEPSDKAHTGGRRPKTARGSTAKPQASTTAKAKPQASRRAEASRRPARGAKRRAPVSSASRQEQVLAEIERAPGTTVPEIGKRLGVDYTGLYRVVRRLEESGRIRKDGAKLELADQGATAA